MSVVTEKKKNETKKKKRTEPVPLSILFIFGKLVLTNPVVCACNAFIIYNNASLFLQHLVKKHSLPVTLFLFFFHQPETSFKNYVGPGEKRKKQINSRRRRLARSFRFISLWFLRSSVVIARARIITSFDLRVRR